MGSYKRGIDYFPFDTSLISDRKFRKLRLTHGAVCVLVYLSLLTSIFEDNGYSLDYDGETKQDVIWEVLNDLQGKDQPSAAKVEEIIAGLAESGLFDKRLYSAGVLTSRRIQEVFYRITADRKSTKVDYSRWLLDRDQMAAISSKSMILKNFPDQADSSANRTDFDPNRADESQNRADEKQRKEKQTKEKESKGEKNAASGGAEVAPAGKYGTFGHVTMTPEEYGKLEKAYGKGLTQQAVQILDEYIEMTGKRYSNCALAIRRWGIDAARERNGGQKKTKTAFHNFQQAAYDYDSIAKALAQKREKP